jgi:hypothetical protein
MKTTKAAKAERRAHRKSPGRRRRNDGLTLRAIGGTMDPDLVERILSAVGDLDMGAPWPAIAPNVLPVLKRVRQPYPPDLAPFHMRVPPGIPTGFGIDMGPAFSHVTAAMLEGWAVDRAIVLGTALDNLRRLTVVEPPQVQAFSYAGVEVMTIQGQGWGSALLLLPDVLAPILGSGPRTLLAPIRNAVVALPDDVDADIAIDVWAALTEGAHDELDVDPVRWNGAEVVAAGDASRGLPN